MDTSEINRYIETQQIVFDYIKQITTLNTGSIVLISTLLEKVFPNATWKPLIVIIFSGFILSVGLLTLSGFGIIRSIRTPEKISEDLVNFTTWAFILGMVAFFIALLSLAAFTVKNLL